MRLALAALLALPLACRRAAPTGGAPAARAPSTDRPVADAPRVPSGPCDDVAAEGARALDAWRRYATGVTDAATWAALASFNRCEVTQRGVWATVLDPPASDASRDQLAGRFKLVFVPLGGARAEAYPALVESGEAFTLRPNETNWSHCDAGRTRMGPWTLFDYDGDQVPEVLIPLDEHVEERGDASYLLVWKAALNRVQPYEPAMGLHPVAADDPDHDGRPDLVTYAGLLGEYSHAAGASGTLRGPRLIAFARDSGLFVTSSGDALARNRALCPGAPTSYFARTPGGVDAQRSAVNVACAALWGVAEAAVRGALQRECAPASAQTPPGGCSDYVPALLEIARATPQADLRAAVSLHTEDAPEADAGDTEIPRQRLTLVVDGLAGAARPSVDLGVVEGGCTVNPGDARLGEVAAVRCWYAGGGDEFRALRRGPSLLVQSRRVDERSPPSPWVERGRLAVAANVALRAGEVD